MRVVWKTLLELFEVLPRGAKPFYIWYSISTALLAFLDTAALTLVLLTVTPMLTGKDIVIPVLGTFKGGQVGIIAVLVCALFILKGAFALGLHYFATRTFARYELEVGDRLFTRYMRATWEERARLSTPEVTRLIDVSMARANNGFILPFSQVPGNAFTLLAVLAVLIVGDPVTALVTFVYLGIIMLFMVFFIARRQRVVGETERKYSFLAARIMTEMVEALKEVTLRGRLGDAGRVLHERREHATRARATGAFLAYVPKYSLEASLIGGFLVVGGTGYLLGGVTQGVASISLFAATGFRIIPALTGLQNAIGAVNGNLVFAKEVVQELHTAADLAERPGAEGVPDTSELPAAPRSLQLRDVSFRYPGAEEDVLRGLTLEVPFGSSLAIVGPSGAGKSTLIDLLLGLSTPTGGEITLDGEPLSNVLQQWRSRVGYVPQRVALFDGSIAQNVALTWDDDFDAAQVERCLRRAHLTALLERPEGLAARIGERGQQISGGQQQRLGIARALYSEPLVMVMDEATSSLDTATEKRVTESMRELQGEVTFITVAHRLATIRDYDQICYLDQGRILGQGTFAEVVEQVPDFKVQAQLAGLL